MKKLSYYSHNGQHTSRTCEMLPSEGTIATFCMVNKRQLFTEESSCKSMMYKYKSNSSNEKQQSTYDLRLPSHLIWTAKGCLIDCLILNSKPCSTTIYSKMQLIKQHNKKEKEKVWRHNWKRNQVKSASKWLDCITQSRSYLNLAKTFAGFKSGSSCFTSW